MHLLEAVHLYGSRLRKMSSVSLSEAVLFYLPCKYADNEVNKMIDGSYVILSGPIHQHAPFTVICVISEVRFCLNIIPG